MQHQQPFLNSVNQYGYNAHRESSVPAYWTNVDSNKNIKPIPTLIKELEHLLPTNNKYEWKQKGMSSINHKHQNGGNDETFYGIIMDAGSTGTRIFIYEWDKPKDCHLSPFIRPSFYKDGPKQGKQFKVKKLGGLAELQPSQVADYLSDFIGNATEFIPSHKRSDTPIFLKATAGMRLLPRTHSHALMEEVRATLSKSPFKFDPKFGAQVIPGEYEGVFGWLAVNYLAGILDGDEDPEQTHGMLDMGGASCQITFETPQVPMENSFPINLNGTSRVVYTHSYLRFGRNEARFRYYINNEPSTDSEKASDPCYIKGYEGVTNSGVRFIGTGDFDACINNVEPLMLKDPFCPTMSCAVNGVYQPEIPENMSLIAISGMFKVAKWFKCKGKRSARCLFENANNICSSLTIEEYRNKYKKWEDDKDFNNYCFMAAYIINMLNKGYGIDMDREIYFTEEVEGVDVGWTLGAMIYEVNLMFPSGQCCHPTPSRRF